MLFRSLCFIIFSMLLVSCSSKAPITNRSQFIVISSSQELALGEKSYKSTLEKSKVITNTKEAKRVKQIGEKIARIANKKIISGSLT